MARHYNVTVFKISSSHNNIRKDVMEGTCTELPKIGESFRMRDSYLRTTDVKSIARVGDTVTFETQNSTYAVHIDSEFDDEAPKVDPQLELEF